MEYSNFPKSFREQTEVQINKLQEDLKTENKILERAANRFLIFILKIRISRIIRIVIDIITTSVAFLLLIFVPLGFILYAIVLYLCLKVEGVYRELCLNNESGFLFFLVEITAICLIGHYTTATIFVIAYITTHILIIVLKELVVFGTSSS